MGVASANILNKSGKPINRIYELLSVEVVRDCNKIPTAELVYVDGNPVNQEFKLSDDGFFTPGNEIEIRLKYEDRTESEKTVFKGIVVKQSLRMTPLGGVLTIELSDKAIAMTAGRKSIIFEDKTDSDIITELIKGNGVKPGDIGPATVKHSRFVQYSSTDWDLMMCRAEANGLVVSVTDGVVSAKLPNLGGSPAQTLKFGKDELLEFNFEADTRHQFSKVESIEWDIQEQKLTKAEKGEKFGLSQSKLNSDDLTTTLGSATETLVSGVHLAVGEAKSWADGRMIKNKFSIFRGHIKIRGSAKLKLGDLVKLDKMPKLFTGATIVTGIRHQLLSGEWYTDLQFGLPADWFANKPNVTESAASGLLPGVNGLQVGVVDAFKEDPDKEGRIKIKIPSINGKTNSLWARMTTMDAGKERGFNFFPETGDEVILGFLNDDPRQPVILGSVHSSKANKSPLAYDAEKLINGITSKAGIKILFDNKKKVLTISTSDKNVITLDEEKKSIELKDMNKNTVTLSDKGITLESGKDVIIKSKGDFKVEASGNVEIKGSKTDII